MIHKDPEGYKKLLVYKKSDELHIEVLKLAEMIKGVGLRDKTLNDLQDQMARSARSGKQNIVEGWKRNTTEEYFTFLGYSIASIEELKEDGEDIIRGKYKELRGVKEIMGEKGTEGIDYTKIPFYPLNPLLPFIVQIYLRCKELLMLLNKLQQSLEKKMNDEGTSTVKKKLDDRKQQEDEADKWLREELKKLKGK